MELEIAASSLFSDHVIFSVFASLVRVPFLHCIGLQFISLRSQHRRARLRFGDLAYKVPPGLSVRRYANFQLRSTIAGFSISTTARGLRYVLNKLCPTPRPLGNMEQNG